MTSTSKKRNEPFPEELPALPENKEPKTKKRKLNAKNDKSVLLIKKKKNTALSFNQLTKENTWNKFEQEFYLMKIATHPNKPIYMLGIIENNNDNKQLKILKLEYKYDLKSSFRKQYPINNWYVISAKSTIHNDTTKYIAISTSTQFTKLENKPAPQFDLLLNCENLVNDFQKMITYPENILAQQHFQLYFDNWKTKSYFGEICCVDSKGTYGIIRDWENKQLVHIQRGTAIFFSGLKRKQYFNKYYFIVTGVIHFYENKIPITNLKIINDISTIDWIQEFEEAPSLDFNQINDGKYNGCYIQDDLFKVENISIIQIRNIFKLSDKNNRKLSSIFKAGQVMENDTGTIRKVQKTDKISYAINMKIRHNKTSQTIWMRGFSQIGYDIFQRTAHQLFTNYQMSTIKQLIEPIKYYSFNLLVNLSNKITTLQKIDIITDNEY